MEISGFLTNLGKYNEGELVGKWVHFPISEEKFEEELRKIGIDGVEYEEWFFTDWDPSGIFGEYESLENINSLTEEFSERTPEEQEVILKCVRGRTMDLEEALQKELIYIGNLKDGNMYKTVEELLADYYAEASGMSLYDILNENDDLEMFFDYERLGRDLRLNYAETDEDMPETAGEFYCGDENASDEEIGECYMEESGNDWSALKTLGDYVEDYIDRERYGEMLMSGSSSDYIEMPNGDVWEVI